MIYRGIFFLKYGLDRARHMLSDGLRAIGHALGRHTAAFGMTRPNGGLRTASAIVIAAITLLAGMLALGPLRTHGRPASLLGQLQPSQKFQNGGLTIVVASTIYAEPSESWPMVVEIGPPQLVPSDSVLHVSGLPPTASLSAGHRVSLDVWAVPLVGLPNLEIHVAADAQERSDLTLALIRTDGRALAKAHTLLSILEPIGSTATVAAVKDTSAGDSGRRGQEAAPRNEVMETPPAATSQTTEPEPSRASTNSAIADLPEPVAVTERGSSGQQATPHLVLAKEAASTVMPGPMRANESPDSPQPASAIASTKLGTPQDVLPILAAPSRHEAKTANDRGREASPEAPAGLALRETKIASTLEPSSPAAATSIVPEPPLAPAKTMTQEGRSRAEKMIVRGERDLENGNVAGARQFFLRAAEAGLAQGAFLLASTYDSHEFVRLRFMGVQPNSAIARKWYNYARELGARHAHERLTRLGAAD